MAASTKSQVAYGLNQALIGVFQPPIASKRDPGVNDRAPIGAIWVNTISQDAFILTAISANVSAWSSITGGGSFTTITASGNITSTGGDISATVGDITAGGNLQAGVDITAVGGDITATAGNITAVVGNITTQTGDITSAGDVNATGSVTAVIGDVSSTNGGIFGKTLYARGDLGAVVGSTALTNATNTTQGAGTATILSTTGSLITNTGFLKIYVGNTTAYIPYFTVIG